MVQAICDGDYARGYAACYNIKICCFTAGYAAVSQFHYRKTKENLCPLLKSWNILSRRQPAS